MTDVNNNISRLDSSLSDKWKFRFEFFEILIGLIGDGARATPPPTHSLRIVINKEHFGVST